MPIRRIHPPLASTAAIDFPAIRERLGIAADYPAAAVAEAVEAAAVPPRPTVDRTDLPVVTIDPIGSMDLDQAMHLEQTTTGFVVHYAIADVASFVGETGALHDETWRRGETLYSPDLATPLHPRKLSEGAASLLPDQSRPAALWRIELDARGEPVGARVERALVRSVARLDYLGVQADLDAGRLHPSIAALPEIGRLRQEASRRRHAITLDLPDAEVVQDAAGHWTLDLRAQNEVEKANAEISLLTGICAARMMVDARIGLLRTLPPASADQVALLKKSASTLGIDWPDGAPAGDVIAGLDGSAPKVAAFLDDAVHLLRGAGYTPFDGAVPVQPMHAGVGSIYAHVTAPLRRLADRYATEVCLALCAGIPVPQWTKDALPGLPSVMTASARRASELERACTGAVSVFLLTGRQGDLFQATVLQVDPAKNQATVLLHEPPVRARCSATGLAEGSVGSVRLRSVDPTTNTFVVVAVELAVPGDAVPGDAITLVAV